MFTQYNVLIESVPCFTSLLQYSDENVFKPLIIMQKYAIWVLIEQVYSAIFDSVKKRWFRDYTRIPWFHAVSLK